MDQETWKLVLKYLAAKENGSGDLEIKLLEQDLKAWAANDAERQEELNEALLLWADTAEMPEDTEWKESFSILKKQIIEQKPVKKLKLVRWWSATAAAAVIAALIFFASTDKKAQLFSEAPIVWLTKTAEPGKIMNIMLPDSSQIWLNSGSSISFPENLNKAQIRNVKLSGEAFFKVKRDPAHPFVVKSLNIQTRVLGTSFNIRAWENSKPEVTVLTGKVAVSRDSAGIQSAAVHLLPNQKVSYQSKSGLLIRENVENAEAAISWQEGKLIFDNTPMEEVFRSISRKYAVKIISDQSFNNCKLTAKFDHVSVQEVLHTIELTFDIKYSINKQTIYIKGGKCN